jgi:hypothetical protein
MTLALNDLHQALDYEPVSGKFYWKVERNAYGGKTKAGDAAGHTAKNGYVLIGVNGRVYRAHRLAWFYVHGKWPGSAIDHIDGNKANNSIGNLREVTLAQNAQNMHKAHRDSACGLLGVERHTQCDRYSARIAIGGKRRYLGLFKTPQEAHAAYLAAKAQEHPAWAQK